MWEEGCEQGHNRTGRLENILLATEERRLYSVSFSVVGVKVGAGKLERKYRLLTFLTSV